MTTQQQSIIDSLVAEFNKMNAPTHNGFMRIGEAVTQLNEWQAKMKASELNNAEMERLKRQRMDEDLAKIQEELRLSGLKLRAENKDGNYYSILIYAPGVFDDKAKLSIIYDFAKTTEHNSAFNMTMATHKSIYINSFDASGSWQTRFDNVEDLFQDAKFYSAFQNLIRLSQK